MSKSWLDGIDGLGEDFLSSINEDAPTEGGFNRKFPLRIDDSKFVRASEKYHAKVEAGVQVNQLSWAGINALTGKDLSQSPNTYSLGHGWNLDTDDGGLAAGRVVSDEYVKFSGQSKYGKIIRGLMTKWGVDADNEASCMCLDEAKGEEFLMGPEARRFMRWYAKRHKAKPDWKDATVWNGVTVQMDKLEETSREGKTTETTFPIGLVSLEGETPAEFKWYTDFLAEIGSEVPWYVCGPGQEMSDRVEPGKESSAPAKASSNGSNGTATKKADAPKSEPAKEDKPAASAPPAAKGELDDSEVIAQLTVLAFEHEFADFKKPAMAIVQKMARWITWVNKEANYNALKDEKAVAPVKK